MENEKENLIKNPIVFAGSAFILSIITAGTFYTLVYTMLKLCVFVDKNMCSTFSHLKQIPPSFFDGVLYIIVILYTFKFKEKMSFLQILKISTCFVFFISIRTFILWNFTVHSNQSFYFMLDVIFTIFGFMVTFFINLIGIKIINLLSLKWLEKRKEMNNKSI